MIRLFASACIDAPCEVVWARLATLEDVQLWAEPVLRARCEVGRSHGIGAERVCALKGNLTIRERWIAWDEGRSFTYEGYGLPMVKRAVNTWSIHPKGDKTLVTSEAQVELKGGVLGRLVEPVLKLMSRRMASNSLAAFKYLVENGCPYPARHSRLPRAPSTC